MLNRHKCTIIKKIRSKTNRTAPAASQPNQKHREISIIQDDVPMRPKYQDDVKKSDLKSDSAAKSFTDERRYTIMTTRPLAGLILSLSAPSALSMLITSVYNMTDTYFVAKLGTSAAAAVGVVFALMSLIQAIGFTVGMGAASSISRLLGARENDAADVYASSAVVMAAILGAVTSASGLLLLEPLMTLLGATETSLPYASQYAAYILVGAPVMCVTFALNAVLRAEGHAAFCTIGIALGGVVNIILDPILIFTLEMGVSGAAIATLISQIISFLVLVSVFITGKTVVKLLPGRVSKSLGLYVKIIANGSPTLCRQGLASLASALLAITSKPYGDAAVAALTIAAKVYAMIRNFIVGIGQGYQPVAGYNYGAANYRRVKRGFFFTLSVGTVICLAAAALIALGSETVMSAFGKDEQEVISVGSDALKTFCFSLPVLGFSTYVNQMLQCLGRNKSAAFLASCRQGVFFVPLIFILTHFFGIVGTEYTQSIADILTFAVSVPFLAVFFAKMPSDDRGSATDRRE